jgi:uncharacterized protein YecE (DUF72 family)
MSVLVTVAEHDGARFGAPPISRAFSIQRAVAPSAAESTGRNVTAEFRVGISGWRYPRWRGDFYPVGLPQRLELNYAAERLTSIEINGSFYSMQRPSSYQRWRAETPDQFVFAVKGPRFVTHMKKLRGVDLALANFLASGPLTLGPKLGPLLWQLPPMLPYDAVRMGDFFDLLPRTAGAAAAQARNHDPALLERRGEAAAVSTDDESRPIRHAVEVRHTSYATEAFATQCRQYDVALVVADTAGKWPFLTEITSDHVYVRLHGDQELYTSGYSDEGIAWWTDRLRTWGEAPGVTSVYVYFDNDAKVHAPWDAIRLIASLSS